MSMRIESQYRRGDVSMLFGEEFLKEIIEEICIKECKRFISNGSLMTGELGYYYLISLLCELGMYKKKNFETKFIQFLGDLNYFEDESSCFTGYASLALVISELNKEEEITKLEKEIDKKMMRNIYSNKNKTFEENLDVIYGNANSLLYCISMFERYSPRNHYDAAILLLKKIESYIESIFNKIDLILGLNEKNYSKGRIGSAHGIAGVISILIIAYKNGIYTSKTKQLITELLNFLFNSPALEQIINSNLSWCHGYTGLVHAILLAKNIGVVTDKYDKYFNNYINVLRDVENNEIYDNLGLCHGLSGLLLEIFIFENMLNFKIDKFQEIKEKIINRIKLEWNKDISFQPGDPESILFGRLGVLFIVLINDGYIFFEDSIVSRLLLKK